MTEADSWTDQAISWQFLAAGASAINAGEDGKHASALESHGPGICRWLMQLGSVFSYFSKNGSDTWPECIHSVD